MAGEQRRAVAGLWCAAGVGPHAISLVREVFPDLGEIADVPVTRWLSSVLLAPVAREGLLGLKASIGSVGEAMLERAAELGMSVAFKDDPAYPRGLGEVHDSPPLLFYKGRGDRLNGPKRLATVGSRSYEPNFTDAALTLGCQLAQRLILVSGAARGIDQLFHRAALRVNGETWAFTGAALDQLDRSQQVLADEMLAKAGTIFCEYPPGVRADPTTFPRRNRLISGASDAVLLVRAHGDSGAMHTVKYAREQGRLLLAVPGQIDHLTAHGCNQLIRAGIARLVERADDVFADLGLDEDRYPPAVGVEAPEADLSTLSPNAHTALAALDRLGADFDLVLSRAQPLNSGQLASALIELELAGLLVHRPGRRYELR
jgi:DNA processing protein